MRTARLCLVLAAIGATLLAVEASTAAASPPEFGRCVRLGTKTGNYGNSVCTAKSKAGSGPFEWMPGPGPKPAFSGLGEKVLVETSTGIKIVCAASQFNGSYSGAKTETLTMSLIGCVEQATKTNCQNSTNMGEGEIVSNELEGELGIIKAGKPPVVGLDIKPKSGSVFMDITCGKVPTLALASTVEGSLITAFTPRNKMSEVFKGIYKQTKGVQQIQKFEGGPKDTLTAKTVKGVTVTTEELGVASTREDTNEELMEIKAQ